jgi:hypothetical protein
MTTHFGVRQVSDARWSSGGERAIATLLSEPEQLEPVLRIHFTDQTDELDRLRDAFILLPSGRLMQLLWRPEGGTMIWIDRHVSPREALQEFRAIASIPESAFSWIDDEARD